MNHASWRPGHGADTSGDVGPTLRALGMRMTPQRERVLAAVRRLEHATPDAVAEEVGGDAGAPLSLSTVYRNLEALEQAGIVSHTYLDQRTPSYHMTSHADHLHLLCLGCGRVSDAPVGLADTLARRLMDAVGFVADVRHLAVHGWCAACDASDPQERDFLDSREGHESRDRDERREWEPRRDWDERRDSRERRDWHGSTEGRR